MNLSPETISNLRTLLVPVDRFDARLRDLALQAQQAEAAASRLSTEIASLDKQASEGAAYRIQADKERLAALIGGVTVSLPDKKDIEAHAKRDQVIAAHRLQMADDLAAVRSHIAELAASISYARTAYDAAELTLLSALSEAMVEAYKAAAMDFVRTQMPPLYSLASLIGQKTGKLPDWWGASVTPLRVAWASSTPIPPTLGMSQVLTYKQAEVWPRTHPVFGGKLITGESVNSPDIVEDLISSIREHPDEAPSQIDAAVALIDANLSAEEAAAGQQVH